MNAPFTPKPDMAGEYLDIARIHASPAKETHRIIAAVASRYGLTPGHLTGAQQARRISVVRQKAYSEVRRQRPHLSLPAIGRAFNRDHTTVLHGIRAHEARMAWVECLIAAGDCNQPDLFARAA